MSQISQLPPLSIAGLNGQAFDFSDLKGKSVLFVNVASACGLTPHYEGLQQLYQTYKDRGFVVVGLPCNQFGAQEPGSEEEIQTFCSTRFNVSFPMTTKIEVNGANRHPIYKWLIGDGEDISWNFEKFLVHKDGVSIERFGPKTEPHSQELITAIENSL